MLVRQQTKNKFDVKYDRHRAIKSEWFKIFHWLIHAKDENMFRCKSCVETKQNNIFVTGQDATKLKKDDFIKHEKSNDHIASILGKDRQNDLKKATANVQSNARETITGLMKTILLMAQEDIPNSKDRQTENVSRFDYECIFQWVYLSSL